MTKTHTSCAVHEELKSGTKYPIGTVVYHVSSGYCWLKVADEWAPIIWEKAECDGTAPPALRELLPSSAWRIERLEF